MTATIEQEVEQKVREEIQAFTMPKPSMGQNVTWYPSADKNSGQREVVRVIRVGRHALMVERISGTCVDGVAHVDDPKLKLRAERRENGAWDFTDYDKQMAVDRTRMEELDARLKLVEELLEAPKKSK